MATEPILLTMARTLDRDEIDYRVLARSGDTTRGTTYDTELAAIQLNRRICLPDGQVHTIVHHGGLFSIDSELRGATDGLSVSSAGSKSGGDPCLAIFHRERTGLLSHRNVLIVESQPPRRLLLRRRSWFGSPANVDVVPLSEPNEISPPEVPVLLRAEKSGTLRQRLLARWTAPGDLPTPIMLFVLNVLADLDRRAAVAASAGAAGL